MLNYFHIPLSNIDNIIGLFGDILFLDDSIFSICHKPAGSLIDSGLDDVEETIEILSQL